MYTRQPDAIRVLLVDDQRLLREGLRTLLELHPDLHVVGEAGDGQEAEALTAGLEPQVVLMDLRTHLARFNGAVSSWSATLEGHVRRTAPASRRRDVTAPASTADQHRAALGGRHPQRLCGSPGSRRILRHGRGQRAGQCARQVRRERRIQSIGQAGSRHQAHQLDDEERLVDVGSV